MPSNKIPRPLRGLPPFSKGAFVLTTLIACLFLTSCAVGPDYVKPKVSIPNHYKETTNNQWKIATPQDACERGNWWEVFQDPQLNNLEAQLNISNQTIEQAKANYKQARALVDEASASYFPLIGATASITRQKFGNTSTISSKDNPVTNHSLGLEASWEPDLWGTTRRNVEYNITSAQAQAAKLALTRLSAQATLAQTYFQLRALDTDQKLLDQAVLDNQTLLTYSKNRYSSGVDALSDIVRAESQLQAAQALAINNGIARAQLEHAIAVLIGQTPSTFSLPAMPLRNVTLPEIPLDVPSVLLERRPDIAQSEREVAAANAKIGVAMSAYYPNLTLSANGSLQGDGMSQWFSLTSLIWSVGPSLAQTLFDGGLRKATTAAARANYEATVANYRQTVLSAFQEVEDNLAALRILNAETKIQNKAAKNARLALKLVTNQYKVGTLTYADVMTAQLAAFTAEKTAADINAQRMTTTVTLIKALGGGWHS